MCPSSQGPLMTMVEGVRLEGPPDLTMFAARREKMEDMMQDSRTAAAREEEDIDVELEEDVDVELEESDETDEDDEMVTPSLRLLPDHLIFATQLRDPPPIPSGVRSFGIDDLLSHKSSQGRQAARQQKKEAESPLDLLLGMTSHFDTIKQQTGKLNHPTSPRKLHSCGLFN